MLRTARITCLVLLTLPALALAQVDDAAVPALTCVMPVVPAIGTKLDKTASEKLNAESTAYSSCGNAYIQARRETAAKHQAIANAQIDASNAFAADFNGYVTALGAFSAAQAEKAKKK